MLFGGGGEAEQLRLPESPLGRQAIILPAPPPPSGLAVGDLAVIAAFRAAAHLRRTSGWTSGGRPVEGGGAQQWPLRSRQVQRTREGRALLGSVLEPRVWARRALGGQLEVRGALGTPQSDARCNQDSQEGPQVEDPRQDVLRKCSAGRALSAPNQRMFGVSGRCLQDGARERPAAGLVRVGGGGCLTPLSGVS